MILTIPVILPIIGISLLAAVVCGLVGYFSSKGDGDRW